MPQHVIPVQQRFIPDVLLHPVKVASTVRLASAGHQPDLDQITDRAGHGGGADLEPIRQLGGGQCPAFGGHQTGQYAGGHPGDPGLGHHIAEVLDELCDCLRVTFGLIGGSAA